MHPLIPHAMFISCPLTAPLPPPTNQTLTKVHESGILSVRGNHDDRAAGYWHRWITRGESPEDADFDWVKDLDAGAGDFLLNLPFTISLEAYGVLVVHGGLLPGMLLQSQDLAVMYTIRFVVPARPPPFGSFSWALERRVLAEAVRTGRITVPPAYQLEARERPDWKEGRPWSGQWQGPQHIIFGHASSRWVGAGAGGGGAAGRDMLAALRGTMRAPARKGAGGPDSCSNPVLSARGGPPGHGPPCHAPRLAGGSTPRALRDSMRAPPSSSLKHRAPPGCCSWSPLPPGSTRGAWGAATSPPASCRR